MIDIGEMVRAANPVPDGGSELGDDEITALLFLVTDRSTGMDVRERRETQSDAPGTRRGLLAAVAAFAVVVLAVGTAWLLAASGGRDPATPSTTQATPTSEATPTTTSAGDGALTPDEEAFVETFAAAFNAGEYGSYPGSYSDFLGLFAPDATIETGLNDEASLDELREELIFHAAMEARWEVVSCRTELGAILCQVDATSNAPGSGGQPVRQGVRVVVEGGKVAHYTVSVNTAARAGKLAAFYDWVEANHPEALPAMKEGDEPGRPILTRTSMDLWRELLPEYYAETGD